MTHPPALDPRLLDAVADAWERGWRPADLVHALGRTAPTLTGLAAAVAVASVEALGREKRVPEEWRRQKAELALRVAGTPAWPDDVRALLLSVRMLPPLPHLGEPPSRWGRASGSDAGTAGHRAGSGPRGGHRDREAAATDGARAMRRIRSLLAKAESTDYPEEAEALTAKAQELMAAHAIDAALVDAALPDGARLGGGPGAGGNSSGGVTERRFHLEPPYLDAKMHLVTAVAGANGVRAAWFGSLGIAVLVGLPADLDAVELLVTSLLVQAGRAMAAAGRRGDPHARSRGFRRAFLLAYAVRVGERLEESRCTATAEAAAARGADLAPVLRNRDIAVARTFDELFPRLQRKRTTRVDRSGWVTGRAAADSADLKRKRPLTS